ncbi:MAG: hypothetical protein CMH56_01305 [Myxococcales bacterium]|nr:hypothetical protein [Myxococcales bacterium]
MYIIRNVAQKPTIFLGLASEGMGHATRARTLINQLKSNYEVHVFCGGRVYDYLVQHHPHVYPISYVALQYRDNQFKLLSSIWKNLRVVPGLFRSIFKVARMAKRLDPVVFISDFDCITSWASMLCGKKVIAIDNQHVHPYASFPVADGDKTAARMLKYICHFNVPIKHRVLVSSFFQPKLKAGINRKKVRYVPTSVRQEVLQRKAMVKNTGPVLVYQTSESNEALHETLSNAVAQSELSFAVYGTGQEGERQNGRIQYKSFDEDSFLNDMAQAPFVMVNGGHSTICEALSLGKPILAEPIGEQYEQIFNVEALTEMGVGMGVRKLDTQDILHFSRCVPLMQKRAEHLNVVDNEGLLAQLHGCIHELNPAKAPNTTHLGHSPVLRPNNLVKGKLA